MDIISFLIYFMIATFTPGPTNIVIMSTVHNFGAKKAMKYTYGATIGFGLLLVISAMLNTMLITIIPKILIVMQTIMLIGFSAFTTTLFSLNIRRVLIAELIPAYGSLSFARV